jgi:antitoxin HigA-1
VKSRRPVAIHPGEILRDEFLVPLGITSADLAQHLGAPAPMIEDITSEKRGITPEVAWLLAQAFGTSPELWMNLQTTYDLTRTRPKRSIPALAQRRAS